MWGFGERRSRAACAAWQMSSMRWRVARSGGERVRASRVAMREVWEAAGGVEGGGAGSWEGCLGRWKRLLRVRLSLEGIEAREEKEGVRV